VDLVSVSRRIAALALIALPAAVILAFWPGSLAAFAPYKALALLLLAAAASAGTALGLPRPVPRALLWAWLAFAGALTLSGILGHDPWRSIEGGYPRYESLPALVAAVALVWLGPAVLDKKGVAHASESILASLAILGVYSVAQALGADPLHLTQAGRAWGTIGNPILLGTATATLVPYAAVVSLTGRGTLLMRRLAPAAAALGAAACLASQSRAAGLALVAGVLAALALAWPAVDRRRLAITGGIVAIVVAAALLIPASRTVITSRLGSGLSIEAEARALKWRVGLELVRERPLLGWGWDTVAEVYPSKVPRDWLKQDPERVITDRLHNEWLDVTVATGLVGLLALAAVAAAALWTARPGLRAGPTSRALTAGLMGNAAAYAVSSVTGFPAISTWPLLWISLGLAVALGLTASAQDKDGAAANDASQAKAVRRIGGSAGAVLRRFMGRATGADLTGIAVALGALSIVGVTWTVQGIAADRALFSAMMTPGQYQAAAYERAAGTYPNDPHVQLGSADGLLAVGRATNDLTKISEARLIAGRALEVRPHDPAFLAMFAETLLASAIRGQSGMLPAAEQAYSAALKAAPYDPTNLQNAGIVQFSKETTAGYANAERFWLLGFQVDPSKADLALDLALAYEAQHRYSEARRWVNVAEKISPTLPDLADTKKRLVGKR
jgi:O-antigen ligase